MNDRLKIRLNSMGLDAPLQNIVVGVVLVLAVWVDTIYRQRAT